ncbi:MAG: hypothetical protein WD766_00015 [Gemmatimonadota bacterium]
MTCRSNSSAQPRGSGRKAVLLVLGLAVTAAGCENALEVELPGQITEEGTFIPAQADVLVASAIADIECGMSDFIAFNAAGAEDVGMKTTGWYGSNLQYSPSPGGTCHTSSTSVGSFTSLQKGRWMAEQSYERLTDWTVEEAPNRERLLATAAIYAGLTYTFFGELYCEITANTGPLMSSQQSLEVAEEWFTKALTHIQSTGDFAIPSGVTSSARQMAHLLRARARFGMDDLTGAESDALQVQQGFTSWYTRDEGGEPQRWNRVFASQVGTNGWVAIVGPIDYWSGPPNPVTGQPWPEVIPFTGYWDLGVLPDGRAISATEHPITTTDFAAAVADPRVPVVNTGNDRGGPRQYPILISQKYSSEDADIPLAKWQEAWFILAQIRKGQAAIDLVNDIRDAAGLPQVSYLSPADAAGVEDMVIEEIRREHFLEARFWSTKLRYNLWFPRGVGQDAWGQGYSTGVRLVMPGNEFDLNPNLDETDRGSMCVAHENPVT